jgi:hypothetical protein
VSPPPPGLEGVVVAFCRNWRAFGFSRLGIRLRWRGLECLCVPLPYTQPLHHIPPHSSTLPPPPLTVAMTLSVPGHLLHATTSSTSCMAPRVRSSSRKRKRSPQPMCRRGAQGAMGGAPAQAHACVELSESGMCGWVRVKTGGGCIHNHSYIPSTPLSTPHSRCPTAEVLPSPARPRQTPLNPP